MGGAWRASGSGRQRQASRPWPRRPATRPEPHAAATIFRDVRLNRRQPLADVVACGRQRVRKVRQPAAGPSSVGRSRRGSIRPLRHHGPAGSTPLSGGHRTGPAPAGARRWLAGDDIAFGGQRGQLIGGRVQPMRRCRCQDGQRLIGRVSTASCGSRRVSCPSGYKRLEPPPAPWHRPPGGPACRRPAVTGVRARAAPAAARKRADECKYYQPCTHARRFWPDFGIRSLAVRRQCKAMLSPGSAKPMHPAGLKPCATDRRAP